jgi:hypothetical protein
MPVDLTDADSESFFPQCMTGYQDDPSTSKGCKHLDRSSRKFRCNAFPKGIPDEIGIGTHDHRKPFKGDSGIVFEPLT